MKRTVPHSSKTWLSLAMMVWLFSPSAFSGEAGKSDRLQERLAALSAAFNAADVATLEGLLSEHYSHTNNSSPPLDKKAWLASIEKRRADMEEGILKITDVKTSEIEVQAAGDTAVATGLYVMRGQRNDQPFGLSIRYTQVWEWDGEDWYRVAFHDTYEPLTD